MVSLRHSTIRKEDFWNIVKCEGFEILSVPLNPNNCHIYYRPGHEKQAQELKDIADKYNGYLACWATEQDSRRIGELLQYDPKARPTPLSGLLDPFFDELRDPNTRLPNG